VNTTRVYDPAKRVAHLVEDANIFMTVATSDTLCGRTHPDGGWRGTGSQSEYDEAERRVTCRECAEAAKPPPPRERTWPIPNSHSIDGVNGALVYGAGVRR
jgi:hypothetical protein